MGSEHQRTRRQLPQRVRRLRWLRESMRDPPGCERSTQVDEIAVTARNNGDGRVMLRCGTSREGVRVAEELFGGRYTTVLEDGELCYLGRPL